MRTLARRLAMLASLALWRPALAQPDATPPPTAESPVAPASTAIAPAPATQPAPPPGYYAPIYGPQPEQPIAPPPVAPQPTARAPKPEHPPARTGFQMALRFGFHAPGGSATAESGDTQSARFSPQFATEIAMGGKVSESVYVGAYAGAWIGAEGSDPYTSGLCSGGATHDVSCGTTSTRLGVEVQYHFAPAALVNPWLGYGLAYESAWERIDDHVARRSERSYVEGMQYGRLQAGLDFRLGTVIGLGPYLALEVGRYTRESTEINGRETHSGGVAHPAIHTWLGSGVRMVLFS